MAETHKVFCDNCNRDLTSTGNSVDYRLVLKSEPKIPWYVEEGQPGGAVTAMMIYPPIKKAAHFCDLACLDKWREKERES